VANELIMSEDAAVVWRLLGSAERTSEHPVGHAMYEHAQKVLAAEDIPEAQNFHAIPGEGLVCTVGEKKISVGNRLRMRNYGCALTPQQDAAMQLWENEGKTVVCAAEEGRLLAIIAVSDQVKPESRAVIARLAQSGITTWLISGDNYRVAHAIGRVVGVKNVMGGVLPGEKSLKVKEIQEQGANVCFVGDGVNDAVALAQADIGISLAAGTDIANDAAQITLLKNDLRDVFAAIHLSSYVFRRIKLNFLWALGYNVIAIPLAAGVFYPLVGLALPPWLAALLEAMSTVVVVTSSILLNLYTKPKISLLGEGEHQRGEEVVLAEETARLLDSEL